MGEHIPNLPPDPQGLGQWLYALVAGAAAGAGFGSGRFTRRRKPLGDIEDDPVAKAIVEVTRIASETSQESTARIVAAIQEMSQQNQAAHKSTQDELRKVNDATRNAITALMTAMHEKLNGVDAKATVTLALLERSRG